MEEGGSSSTGYKIKQENISPTSSDHHHHQNIRIKEEPKDEADHHHHQNIRIKEEPKDEAESNSTGTGSDSDSSPSPLNSSINIFSPIPRPLNFKRKDGPKISADHSPKNTKRKGPHPGSGSTQITAADISDAIGESERRFTSHTLNLKAGEDVVDSILNLSRACKRQSVIILSASGTVSNVSLRIPDGGGGSCMHRGIFHILSLSGSYIFTTKPMRGHRRRKEVLFSILMSDTNGNVFGGSIANSLIAAGPLQVVVGTFKQDSLTEPKKNKKSNESSPVIAALPLNVFGGNSNLENVIPTEHSKILVEGQTNYPSRIFEFLPTTHGDQAATRDDQAAMHDDQAATYDDQTATYDDQAANRDDQVATCDDQAATRDDQVATCDDQAAMHDDQAATHDDQASTHDDQASTHDDQASTHDDQAANNQAATHDDQTANNQASNNQAATHDHRAATPDDQASDDQAANNQTAIHDDQASDDQAADNQTAIHDDQAAIHNDQAAPPDDQASNNQTATHDDQAATPDEQAATCDDKAANNLDNNSASVDGFGV